MLYCNPLLDQLVVVVVVLGGGGGVPGVTVKGIITFPVFIHRTFKSLLLLVFEITDVRVNTFLL